jgi:hypothetical protein
MVRMTSHTAPFQRAFVLLALLLAAPATTRADDLDDENERPYYGLAMAGAYVAAPVLGIAAGVTLGPRVGVPVFLLTPPIVHLAYADPWWALASLLGSPVSTVSTSLLMIALSQCSFGVGLGGSANCDGPGTLGAVVGYMAWTVLDVTVSSLRGTSRLHDNSKRSPQPVHEPSTPAAPPSASVDACLIDRSRG